MNRNLKGKTDFSKPEKEEANYNEGFISSFYPEFKQPPVKGNKVSFPIHPKAMDEIHYYYRAGVIGCQLLWYPWDRAKMGGIGLRRLLHGVMLLDDALFKVLTKSEQEYFKGWKSKWLGIWEKDDEEVKAIATQYLLPLDINGCTQPVQVVKAIASGLAIMEDEYAVGALQVTRIDVLPKVYEIVRGWLLDWFTPEYDCIEEVVLDWVVRGAIMGFHLDYLRGFLAMLAERPMLFRQYAHYWTVEHDVTMQVITAQLVWTWARDRWTLRNTADITLTVGDALFAWSKGVGRFMTKVEEEGGLKDILAFFNKFEIPFTGMYKDTVLAPDKWGPRVHRKYIPGLPRWLPYSARWLQESYRRAKTGDIPFMYDVMEKARNEPDGFIPFIEATYGPMINPHNRNLDKLAGCRLRIQR